MAFVHNETDERYVFFYDDQSRIKMIHTLMQYGFDNEVSITPHDAAILCQDVRQRAKDCL